MLTFRTTEEITLLSNSKINGSNLAGFDTVVQDGSNHWTYFVRYVLKDSDPEGVVNFQINVKNSAGRNSITTETTTDGSSVTVY
jgi:hypothetical protein